MLTVYHNSACSKSNGVCELLKQHQQLTDIIEYLNTPPTQETLLLLLQQLNMKPSELIRRNEPMFKTLFESETLLTEEACLQAMLQHPILIERPIVVKDGKAMIARPPELVLQWIE